MSRTLRATSYGPEYEALLVKAKSEGSITITLDNPQRAKSLRSKLYAYFTALRKEALRPDLIIIADSLSLLLTGSGEALTLAPASSSWDNVAIRSALGLEVTPAGALTPVNHVQAPEHPDAMVKRLQVLREAEGK